MLLLLLVLLTSSRVKNDDDVLLLMIHVLLGLTDRFVFVGKGRFDSLTNVSLLAVRLLQLCCVEL
jgi:hypothetical protein